ncbi:hypothetical protein HHK36_012360 [Tetracentron sinense]|uniref:GRPD C-terminal domain-containing protein n=1 Tax=Tetracentron sinense TaxID=13715 RepID=A0A834ZCY5_TETSI|nr:hypothetical protein HHK36_012360 [Tetracentron sinense]
MSMISNGTEISDDTTIRSFSEISDEGGIRVSIDLVAAARRHLEFLRTVAESQWLHHQPTLLQAIRRYDELWMPLISDLSVGSTAPMLLPPFDIQWVWHCHTLNPVGYRQYCESRFSKLVGKAVIFDDENEEYALNRCREIWSIRYPSEPFENEVDFDSQVTSVTNEGLLAEVTKQRFLYWKFSEPNMWEIVYLIAARQRYRRFLYLLQRLADGYSRLVPTSDILLMWLTHQSNPSKYEGDMKEMEGELEKVVGVWDSVKEEDVQVSKKLWERMFDQPYEKAGATLDGICPIKSPVYWEVSDTDVNRKYKSMEPRFLLETIVGVHSSRVWTSLSRAELNLGVILWPKSRKLDKNIPQLKLNSKRSTWHLYSEFGTRGIILELRQHGGGGLFKGTSLRNTISFLWNDLLRAPSLTQAKEVDHRLSAVASITPPVQAPYLLKCVPDRVTDDSGAMISDVILRMNRYRPQEGRWLSRTVLDHAGRECFVVRTRVGSGFWRRGGETPATVKSEDRIVEIREGSWSYADIFNSSRYTEKVVGTATPKAAESREKKASWSLSTGDELTIQWEPSSSSSSSSSELQVKLLKGRKMKYRIKEFGSESKEMEDYHEEEEEDEEEGFVTLVRATEENPNGRATALLNWKLLVVELLPDEDAVLVLLLCISILRSVSEMRREDIGSLLVRRRLKETKLGTRDWGSVLLHPSSCSSSISSPHLQPWYLNAKTVMASEETDHTTRQPAFSYSPAEGGYKLYKRGIIT